MVGLLSLAAEGHEAAVARLLGGLMERDELPNLQTMVEQVQPAPSLVPSVRIELPPLAEYDQLLAVAA